jgi:hypothetical protein
MKADMPPINPYAAPTAIGEDPEASHVAGVESPVVRRAARLAGVVLVLLTVRKGTDLVPGLWRFVTMRPVGGTLPLLVIPLGVAALYALLFLIPAASFLRGRLRYRALAISGHLLLLLLGGATMAVSQAAAGGLALTIERIVGQQLPHVVGLMLIVGRPGRARFWIGIGLVSVWVLVVGWMLVAGQP